MNSHGKKLLSLFLTISHLFDYIIALLRPGNCNVLLNTYDRGPERHEAQLRHLEALEPEGDSDDRQTEHDADDSIGCGQLNATDEDPEDIHKKRSRSHITEAHILSEGEKLKTCHLEALNPHRKADDGQGPEQPYDEPQDGGDETAQEKPDQIADKTHFTHLLYPKYRGMRLRED